LVPSLSDTGAAATVDAVLRTLVVVVAGAVDEVVSGGTDVDVAATEGAVVDTGSTTVVTEANAAVVVVTGACTRVVELTDVVGVLVVLGATVVDDVVRMVVRVTGADEGGDEVVTAGRFASPPPPPQAARIARTPEARATRAPGLATARQLKPPREPSTSSAGTRFR